MNGRSFTFNQTRKIKIMKKLSLLCFVALFTFYSSIYAEANENVDGQHRAFIKEMKLGKEKRQEFKALMDKIRPEREAIKQMDGTPQEKKAARDSLHSKYDPQIKAIIGADNFAKILEKRAERKQKFEQRRLNKEQN